MWSTISASVMKNVSICPCRVMGSHHVSDCFLHYMLECSMLPIMRLEALILRHASCFFLQLPGEEKVHYKKTWGASGKKSWSLHLQAPDQRDSVESSACRPRKSEGLTEDGEGEKRNEAKRWNLLLVDTRVLRKRGVTACLWKATGIRNTWYCTYAQIFWRDPPKLGLILMLSYQHPSAGFHVPKKNCKKCSVASWLFVAPCGVLLLPDLRAHEAH